LRRFARTRKERAQQIEQRLDELTVEFIELAQLNRSGAIDESEYAQRESALREAFDEMVARLERGTTGHAPARPAPPLRVIAGI
jgi:hypothetical protein